MKVLTKTGHEIEVTKDKLLIVPEGLFGFEEYTEYALIDSDYEPFIWLQSTQKSDLAFLIIDPFLICAEYETEIDDDTLAKINIKKPEEIIVMTIVTVPQDGSEITANFQGPLIINKNTRQCLQVILTDSQWSTKVSIAELLKNKEGK